jgi:DNA-binding CsgD family transcriptional regulator
LIWFSTRAVLEWILMDRDGCLATIEAGRSIIEESGIHVLDLRLYGQGITLGLSLGDLELVQRLLDEIPTTPITRTLDHAHSCLLLADYSLLKGETAKAIALAETAVKRSQGGGNRIIEAFSLAGLIQALYQDGQMKRAATVLEEGLILAKGMNHFTSYFQLLAAYFALLRNDLKEAHQLLRKGFGLAARQGYLNYHPWRDAIMVRICREAIAADIEVEYVNRLAARHQLDITPADQVSLTPKEIEILTWVQEGKTSWEIAKILGITERTVNFHVGNVLRKLEVNSRSQALAVAMRLGFLNKS